MKIAIPLFNGRISPRFDFSPEMWVVTVENGVLVDQERFSLTNLNLPQRLEQVTSKGVNKMICGGIDRSSLDHLGNRGIDVVPDIMGDAELAFNLFMRGKLRPGFCCEKRGGFCPGRKGSGGRRS
jgi:predicted Fe-Mo cluster-binding NifX family protein